MTSPDRPPGDAPGSRVAFRERLSAPVSWWVLAGLLVLSAVVAIGFYLGPVWALVVAVVGGLATALVLARPAVSIEVTPDGVRVGRNLLEHAYVGGCRALTDEEARRRSGPEADARAFLVLRPFVATAVEITVADAADPVPYWLVSSRRAPQLAEAIQAARTAREASGVRGGDA